MIPDKLKYTKDHEWIKMEEEIATCGITDHAQSALGDITFIELPQIGKEVKKGDPVSTVESVKAASDIYAPVSGRITQVNDSLNDTPEIINNSPYEEGWIFRLKVSDAAQAEDLMTYQEYQKFLEEKA